MKARNLILSLLTLSVFLLSCSGDEALSEAGSDQITGPQPTPDQVNSPKAKADAPPMVDTVQVVEDAQEPPEEADTQSATDSTEDSAPDVPSEDVAPVEEPEVKFVAFGDAGKANDGQKAVAKAVKEKCDKDGCDFILLLGDNIYDSGVESLEDPQWQTKFEEPYAEIDVVFRPSLGNHDNGGLTLGIGGPPIDVFGEGGGTGMEFARGDIQIAYSAISEKWDMPARYYDWTQGSAHFFALDTNSMMFDQHADQAADMVNRITQSTSTWKIAYGHHPYVSNGRHGNAGSYDLPDWLDWLPSILGDLGDTISGTSVKAGMETIVCPTGIDLYLSGHDHNRQWLPGPDHCSDVEFIVSGAGASTTDFEDNQTNFFQDDSLEGFLWVRIKGNTLHAEFIDTTGAINFVRDLTK